MREAPGRQNTPHIWDVVDQWSILNGMYMKRRKVYREGGFILDEHVEEDHPTIKGGPHFLDMSDKASRMTPAMNIIRT
jgi:hypothetical protein